MKKITIFLICIIAGFAVNAQTTFTFTGGAGGTGQSWTEPTNWDTYPGTTINSMDTVEIVGDFIVSINSNEVITNNGTILISDNQPTDNTNFNIFGGSPTVSPGSLINNGTFNITNATMTVSGTLENNGSITILETNFSIAGNGGTLTNSGTLATNLDVPADAQTSSVIFLNEGIITNDINGDITLVTNLINNANFTNNGDVSTQFGIFTNNATVTNNLNLNIFEDFTNTTSATFVNSGNVSIDNFTEMSSSGIFTNQSITGVISITNSSTLNLTSGSTISNQGEISTDVSSRIDFDETFTNDGTIINNNILDFDTQVQLINNGLIVNNADITSSASNSANFPLLENSATGVLQGINNGHSDNFENSGQFSPGNSVSATGTYVLNQSLILEESSSVNIEIASLSDFDNIVADNITFNEPSPSDIFNPVTGTLNVNLINNYEPAIGDTFTIMTTTSGFADPISGKFATANFPIFNGKQIIFDDEDDDADPDPNVTYNPNPDSSTIVLRVIAEVLSTEDFTGNQFKLYPNPSDTFLKVNELNTTEEATINSYTGQRLFSTDISPASNKIDTSSLSSGIYFVTIRDTSQKFIKL